MMAELQRYYGPLKSTAVVPNGRDPQRFGVAEKEPLILAVGRIWDEAKNISTIGRARPFIYWPVCVAGETQHPNGVAPPDVTLNTHLLGKLDSAELASWYARAALYCHPARYEPFGLSVLEAALSGCTLVLGDIPSLRENWEGAAAFVEPNDHCALAAEIQELIANGPRRQSLAREARSRALAFTPAQMTEGYLGIYAELTGARVPAAVHQD